MPPTTVPAQRKKPTAPAAAAHTGPDLDANIKIRASSRNNISRLLSHHFVSTPGAARPNIGATISDLVDGYAKPRLKEAGLTVED